METQTHYQSEDVPPYTLTMDQRRRIDDIEIGNQWRFEHRKIQWLREARGMSQEALAGVLKKPLHTIHMWEEGYWQPAIGDILNICNAFLLDPDFFFVKGGN